MNKYLNMNEISIGTKVKIRNKDLVGKIIEIFHFPTTFKVEFEDKKFNIYKTHELELINSIKEENNE